MNIGNSKHLRSLTPWAGVVLSLFIATALAEHGGRDRTERDDRMTQSRDDRDRDRTRDNDRDTDHESDSRDKSRHSDQDSGKDSGKERDSNHDAKNHERDNHSDHELDTSIVEMAEHRIATDMDMDGRERRSGEVFMAGRDTDLAAIQLAGFKLISTVPLDSLDLSIARIQVRSGESVDQAMKSLRAIVPEAEFASNHLFRPSQQTLKASTEVNNVVLPKANSVRSSQPIVGVIDTGADNTQDNLRVAIVEMQGLTESGYVARAHGTIVSQIACTEGAPLAVADVFDVDTGNQLVAPADAIARGIDWLLSKHVTLINVSIEGPDNVVLSRVIRRAIEKGAVIVAAAGNSGPAAPPVFPAAYPGVIAVTAVDENNNVYPRANRGEYVAFAARGVRIPFNDGVKQGLVTGTSFAAPIVTAEIARRMAASDRSSNAILDAMKHEAIDLGAPGRDDIYGWGLITLQKLPTR